jgi:hypothetical protein
MKDLCIKGEPQGRRVLGYYLSMELNMLTMLLFFVIGAIPRVAAYGQQDQRPLAATNKHSPGWGSVRIRVRATISQLKHDFILNTQPRKQHGSTLATRSTSPSAARSKRSKFT